MQTCMDEGLISIGKNNPNYVIHQQIKNGLRHSKEAGRCESRVDIPVLDKNDEPLVSFLISLYIRLRKCKNIAFGSNKIFTWRRSKLKRLESRRS